MPSLSQSPILQALGYAIANSLWQMALVWIVYVLLTSLFKFKSETKYRVAVAAQITGFAWFIVTLQFYYQQCSHALEVAEAIYLQTGDQNTFVLASEKGSLLSYFIKAEQVLPYLSVAYLLLLAFLTIKWFRAYRYTQLVRLNGLHKIDVDWKLFVTKVSGQLGIKQKVRIYLSELVHSPITIGFLKPVILVPIASINHLTPQQLEAVILHELAHIKRHDYILNIVLSIIELGLFFNPFTRLITKSISKERENSCDDWVLQYQYSPSMYAEALLRIAVLQKSPFLAMHAVKTKGELLSRVQRMVHQKDSRFSYRHQLLALLLMTGILSSMALFDPSTLKAQDIKPSNNDQAVVLEPLAVKVDNVLFNPLSFLNEPLKEEVKKRVAENQKQQYKTRKALRTEDREIELPQVMAPMGIENLKELEKSLARSLESDLKKNLRTIPAKLRLAQNYAIAMDTLQFGGNITFLTHNNVQGMAEELKKSQKELEEAFKKGFISKTEAKKMQMDIAEAFKNLKDIDFPQFYSFVPAITAAEGFYRHGSAAAENESEKQRIRAANEKRRILKAEGKNGFKSKTPSVDSTKHLYMAKAGARLPHNGETIGFSTLTEDAQYVVVDGRPIEHVREMKTSAPVVKTRTLPRASAKGSTGYTYIYSDVGDECEKANRNDRSRKVNTTVIVQGRGSRIAVTKPKKTPTQPKTNCCSINNNAHVHTEAEATSFEFEMQ
jgi:beta-lactamase regulating signal transducer with metallopeptidase domain